MALKTGWVLREGYEDEERGDWCNNFGGCAGNFNTYGDEFYHHDATGRRFCRECAEKNGAFDD